MQADIQADGGLEPAVFDRIRNGETLTAVARTYGVGRSILWRYLNKTPERLKTFEQAKLQGAASSVEQAQANLTGALKHSKKHANSAYVQAVRNDADFRKWSAGVTDRQAFGPHDKSLQVTVSIEHLHLGALQAQGSPEAQYLPVGKPIALPLPQVPDSDGADGTGSTDSIELEKQPRLTDGSTRVEQ